MDGWASLKVRIYIFIQKGIPKRTEGAPERRDSRTLDPGRRIKGAPEGQDSRTFDQGRRAESIYLYRRIFRKGSKEPQRGRIPEPLIKGEGQNLYIYTEGSSEKDQRSSREAGFQNP